MLREGNIWRKWDLHVHAPNTALANQYTKVDGKEDWQRFCEIIEESDVSVIGITDYFSIDSFYKFKSEFDKFCSIRGITSEKFFVPNLELRTNDSLNSSDCYVNIHIIFNPNLQRTTYEEFAALVKVTCEDSHERSLHAIAQDYEGQRRGSLTVSIDNLHDALKSVFGRDNQRVSDSAILIASANKDGLSPGSGPVSERRGSIIDKYDMLIDGVFGKGKDRAYWLNVKRNSRGPKKHPTFRGCDAHSFEDLESFLGKEARIGTRVNEINWVKAESSWAGLQQALIEPEERVTIGRSPLDSMRDDDKVIKSVSFSTESSFPVEIPLNPGLTSIIGSRSSGKSTLLAHIAHAALGKQLEKGTENALETALSGPAAGFTWSEVSNDCANLSWSSGRTSGKVVYIPQGYLTTLGEDSKTIQELLVPYLAETSPELYEALKTCHDVKESFRKLASEKVSLIFKTFEEVQRIEKQRSDISPKREDLTNRLKMFTEEIEQKKTDADISDEQLNAAIEHLQTLARVKSTVKEADDNHKDIVGKSVDELFDIPAELATAIFTLSSEEKAKFIQLQTINRQQLVKSLKAFVEDVTGNREKCLHSAQHQLQELERQSSSHEKILKQSEELESLTVKHSGVLEKLQHWDMLTGQINEQERIRNEAIKALKDSCTILDAKLSDFVAKCHVRASGIDNLYITAEIVENRTKLEVALEDLDQRKSREFRERMLDSTYVNRVNEILEVSQEIEKATLTLKAGRDKVRFIEALCVALPDVMLVAHFDGDRIGGGQTTSMSPGKRALFALSLLLTKEGASWPLLIDQPEDDLDSRSIYETIVPFLLDQKKKRQIIMVSHNANLVVGADSELILVANRHSDKQKNTNGRVFDFCGDCMESDYVNRESSSFLEQQSISQHIVQLLDGGAEAFRRRENKYSSSGVKGF